MVIGSWLLRIVNRNWACRVVGEVGPVECDVEVVNTSARFVRSTDPIEA